MTQTSGSIPHPIAPDYDGSLVLPIELSNASWVLAAQIPDLPCVKSKRTIEPTAEALLAAIEGYRDRARAAMDAARGPPAGADPRANPRWHPAR